MNPNSIITLRNYASQHIYNIVSIRQPTLDSNQKSLKIQSIFKELINKIRILTTCNEVDPHNTPMSLLFQHLRPSIIQLVANCSPNIDKIFIEKALVSNLDWNIRFLNSLIHLGAKDIIIWFFCHIPYYNENILETSQLDKQRAMYIQMLEYIISNYPPNLYFTEKEFVFLSNQTCMPYAASYHNRNNALLLATYCKLLRKICPWINYYSPSLAEKILKRDLNKSSQCVPSYLHSQPQPHIKKKLCFISDSFTTDTSVLRDRICIIGKLDRTKYDVYFASFYPFESICKNSIIAKVFMEKIKDNYIYLGNYSGNNLDTARSILEKYKFDFIVYPDIGMKLLPTLLAYSRIASVQITTWGHSETSGIDTIDYFISSEYFENTQSTLHKAQDNYTEKLILFKSLGTYYISPHKLFIENNPKYIVQCKTQTIQSSQTKELQGMVSYNKGARGAEALVKCGFTKEQNIYVCLQTFYKLTREFEKCLARILELDPNGIILLSNTFPFCKSHLIRIKNIIGKEKLSRLRWYGSLEKDEFLNLVSISDVCLDPFPFGGFNTSYDAFDYNIPVITMDNCEFLHGRFTSGLYRKMGLDDCECIVKTPEEYAQIASSIGINEKLRHKINRNIEMKKNLIFQEQESVEEWNQLFSKFNV